MTPASTKPPVPGAPTLKPAGGGAPQSSRFQTQMPQIPGVTESAATIQANQSKRIWIAVAAGVALIVLCIVIWRIAAGSHGRGSTANQELTPSPAPPDPPPATPPAPVAQRAKNEIGTVEELSQSWSSKKFQYSNSVTRETVPAIAIRLPSGNGRAATSYWGILLKAPYGQCDLEYVTDLSQISAKYGYRASHPMVVDPCSSTIYDPQRTGTLPNGSWARGEIVQGAGFRPPMQIEILIEGDRLVAGRSEN
jgi:hypothetical protein